MSESEAAEVMSVLDVSQRLRYGRRGEADRLIAAYDDLLGMTESLRQRIIAGKDA